MLYVHLNIEYLVVYDKNLVFISLHLQRMKVLVAVFLMVSFGSLDASYLAPNVGPFPIEKTLECLSLVKGQLVPEEPPLLPLVPGMSVITDS